MAIERAPIEVISCDPMHERNKFLNLFNIRYKRGEVPGSYFMASRNQIPTPLTTEQPKVNAIIVAAFIRLPDENARRLVVTKEYRICIGGYEWGLCAGLRDGDESYEETARRELFEETGLTAKRVLKVSPPLISSAGMGDEAFAMVWIEAEGEPSRDHMEDSEDIHTELMSYNDIVDLYHRQGRFENVMISGRAWPVLDQIVERGYV